MNSAVHACLRSVTNETTLYCWFSYSRLSLENNSERSTRRWYEVALFYRTLALAVPFFTPLKLTELVDFSAVGDLVIFGAVSDEFGGSPASSFCDE